MGLVAQHWPLKLFPAGDVSIPLRKSGAFLTSATFAGMPAGDLANLSGCNVAIIGASEGSPYQTGQSSHAANAPAALRQASQKFARQLRQYDWDLGGVLPSADEDTGIRDCGDVATDPFDAPGNRRRITDATRAILEAGAAPIILGGDDSIPIPWFAGFEGRGPYTVLQVDAHADWGDVIQGNPFGYGSPMRRAAELDCITGMVQVGTRGLGSGEAWQIADARNWGSRLVTMQEVRRSGLGAALEAIPGGEVLISIDCDGLDPAVLGAVNMPPAG